MIWKKSMYSSVASKMIVIITEGVNTIIYSKKQGKINWLSSPSVILFTTLDVMFKDLPFCMKCFEYPSLNIKFRAALRIFLFDFKPGGGPFSLMNANLSTVPVSCTFSTSITFFFYLFKQSIVEPQLSTIASDVGKATTKDKNL